MRILDTEVPTEIFLFSAFTLLLHLLTNGNYGFFRDELYFISCGKRLAFGYVDQPPLTPIIAFLSNAISGDSLTIFRLPSAVSHSLIVFSTGYLALLLGGDKFASIIACAAALISPLLLVNGHLLTMNAFEPFFWTLITIVITMLTKQQFTSLFFALGVLVGLAVLNKHSSVFFVFCMVLGLLVSQHRTLLFSKGAIIAIAVSFIIILPHLIWQISHDFPILELLKSGQAGKNTDFTIKGFFLGQVLENHPFNFMLVIFGLGFLFFNQSTGGYRFLGIAFLALLALMIFLKAKPYYLSPIYPVLFAIGGICISFLIRGNPLGGWAIVTTLILGGLVLAPLAIPVLSIDSLITYQQKLGITPQRTEKKKYNTLPQHIADQFGWSEIVGATTAAYQQLSEGEKNKTAIFASNYGEASAIDLWGKENGLPTPISTHNNYFLWGNPNNKEQWIAVGGKKESYQRYFDIVEKIVTSKPNPYAMPYENEISIFLVKQPKVSMKELWSKIKNYN